MIFRVPADLHLHTTASDGTWSLPEVINMAEACGLTTISITDHDTVDALTTLSTSHTGLEIIAGIEFGTEYSSHEVHILGYGIDISNRALLKTLEMLKAERESRARAMVERLNELGCSITFSRVKELAGPGTIGRVHIAQALMGAGYTQSVREGFSRYLEINGPAYVPRKKLTIRNAIELIKGAGGVPVLAHPGLVGDDQLVKDVINMGVLGLEVIHSSHDRWQTGKYYRMARQMQVVPTGGSDCHGPQGKDKALIGKYAIPDTWVRELKDLMAVS